MQKGGNSLKELLKRAYLETQKLKQRDGYNKRLTMVTKLAFLVAEAGKQLRLAEIIPFLKVRQPEMVKKKDSLEKYVSACLNTVMKHGKLVPYKLKGVRGNCYCLPE